MKAMQMKKLKILLTVIMVAVDVVSNSKNQIQ